MARNHVLIKAELSGPGHLDSRSSWRFRLVYVQGSSLRAI